MAGQQSIMGWSPNPVYNQPPLPSTQPQPQQPAPPPAHHPHDHGSHAHGPIRQAAAPTPLGAQAFALMSPQGNSTIMSPLTWQSQHDNLSYAMRSPGPGVPFMSPGPGQMMPTLLMPGKFEHYVPSVRYNPTDVNYAFTHQEEEEEEEDNDGFVIVEEKARVPRPRKRQIGRESKLPFGLIKGMKNMFHRKHDPPPVMSTLPAGFVAWPKSPYEIDDAASQHLSEDHTTHAPTNAPTTLPYPSGRTYATWTAGMSPRSGYNSIFNTFRSPDPEPASALLPPPPKPPDWSHASDPTRPSWAYVLHPLLTHKSVGASMMHFDLRLPFSSITVFPPAAHPHLPPPGPVPLSQAQLDSHATWPPCPELTIASVADEPLFPVSPGLPGVFSGSGSFPWPIPVYPRESSEGGSVKVKDVLAALAESAMLHVRPSEYNALSASRREQVKLSYWARCTAASSHTNDGGDEEAERRVQPAPDDGCRRIDVLGTRVMFRGLEPAPSMDGTWVMFLGPP